MIKHTSLSGYLMILLIAFALFPFDLGIARSGGCATQNTNETWARLRHNIMRFSLKMKSHKFFTEVAGVFCDCAANVPPRILSLLSLCVDEVHDYLDSQCFILFSIIALFLTPQPVLAMGSLCLKYVSTYQFIRPLQMPICCRKVCWSLRI